MAFIPSDLGRIGEKGSWEWAGGDFDDGSPIRADLRLDFSNAGFHLRFVDVGLWQTRGIAERLALRSHSKSE
jgi:hypothetical protein